MNTPELILTKQEVAKLETKKVEDGKVARLYYTCEFSDAANPFNAPRIRNFWQQHSADGKTAFWKGADPAKVALFLGKKIPGTIVSKTVAPYKVEGSENTATKYTTVVLAHESIEQVFKAAGHTIVEGAQSPSSEVKSASGIALTA